MVGVRGGYRPRSHWLNPRKEPFGELELGECLPSSPKLDLCLGSLPGKSGQCNFEMTSDRGPLTEDITAESVSSGLSQQRCSARLCLPGACRLLVWTGTSACREKVLKLSSPLGGVSVCLGGGSVSTDRGPHRFSQ